MTQYAFTYNQTSDGLFDREKFAESLYTQGLTGCVVEDNTGGQVFIVHTSEPLTNPQQITLEGLVSAHVGMPTVLRITALVDPQFRSLSPSKVDFRKHLIPGVHVQKDVLFHSSGRPDRAEYTYNGQKVARIRFIFDLNNFWLMTRRRELLGYYTVNDEILEEYTISDETYNIDTSNPNYSEYHMVKTMRERVVCRQYLIEMIKGWLNQFLLEYYMGNYGQEFMQVISTVSPFFKTFDDSITAWLATGSGDFLQQLADDTTYAFLNLQVSPTQTVRQYIIARLEVA